MAWPVLELPTRTCLRVLSVGRVAAETTRRWPRYQGHGYEIPDRFNLGNPTGLGNSVACNKTIIYVLIVWHRASLGSRKEHVLRLVLAAALPGEPRPVRGRDLAMALVIFRFVGHLPGRCNLGPPGFYINIFPLARAVQAVERE